MPDKPAELLKLRGKYLLKIGARNMEIPTGLITPEADIKKMVGKEVSVIFSDKRPGQIIAITRFKRPPILCYIPPLDWARRIHPEVRNGFVRELERDGVISPKLGRSLTGRAQT
jgi:hypothetical protein